MDVAEPEAHDVSWRDILKSKGELQAGVARLDRLEERVAHLRDIVDRCHQLSVENEHLHEALRRLTERNRKLISQSRRRGSHIKHLSSKLHDQKAEKAELCRLVKRLCDAVIEVEGVDVYEQDAVLDRARAWIEGYEREKSET